MMVETQSCDVEHSQMDDEASASAANTIKNKNKDGGYAWVILLSAFLSAVIYSANFSSLGIHFVEFIDYFQVDKWRITILGSLLMTGITLG